MSVRVFNPNSKNHIRVSAPGKIILHGEHAVVYKKTAIAVSLGLRTRLDLNKSDNGEVTFCMERFLEPTSWKAEEFRAIIAQTVVDVAGPETSLDEELIKQLVCFIVYSQHLQNGQGDSPVLESKQQSAVLAFLYVLIKLCALTRREIPPSLSVHLVSEMAVGAGLGSSAAFAVCISASLLTHFGVIICDPTCCDNIAGKLVPQADQLALINHWAFLIEKIIHGNASGIDNTVSTYGGIIKYCDREMSRIACNLQLDVAVVDTQMPRDTKMMVELVQRRRKLYPAVIDNIFNAIDGLSTTAFNVLQRGSGKPTQAEYEVISELMNMNHSLLCALGVSSTALDAVCATARKYGQAAKLTGAGGGGCAIVVFDPGENCNLHAFQRGEEQILSS